MQHPSEFTLHLDNCDSDCPDRNKNTIQMCFIVTLFIVTIWPMSLARNDG